MVIARDHITGLVLAGGRGSRMGGVDKGLQPHLGKLLALHAIDRLGPQVSGLMINANRNLDAYAAFGVPVIPDALADYPGPLAGMLAGLEHCRTPYLATVPCDTPDFPLDLVARLAQSMAEADADVAMVSTREPDGTEQVQPVFCLLKVSLRDSLSAFLLAGERKIDRWTQQQRTVRVVFTEAHEFFNANTLEDLEQLRRP